MEKNIISYFVWLVVVVVLTVVLFWFFCLRSMRVAPTDGGVPSALDGGDGTPAEAAAGAGVSSGRMVLNVAAHYRVVVPASWYVEKNGPTGITLYPDYAPQASSSQVSASLGSVSPQPDCKVEVSTLPNAQNLALGDWLAAYLHQDPSEDIAQTSQSASQVSGHDAITWAGALNGVSTTLAYVAGDGVVYEFAPSAIAADDDCLDALDAILANFTITTP